MDSFNPYRQKSNFIDLLNSQEDSHYPESFSQSTTVGSSQIPLFSTECSDVPIVDQENRQGRKRWKPSEDVVLISSWLNTSKDPIVSNEQKTAAFWNRIAALYAASPSIAADEKREANHCKQRWRKINDQISKFVGAYAAANSPPKSGYGPKDYLKLAHEIFLSDYKAKFMLEHAWELLQNEQKWCELSSTKGVDACSSKRKKCDNGSTPSGSSQSVNDVEDEAEVRPVGVKAAKAKLKRSVSNKATVEEQTKKLENLQRVWELKQKDVALKKELSDKNMLEILLARTEPLSELELALKNRLIEKFLLQTP